MTSLKRLIDIAVAGAGLALFAPTMALISLIVATESPGGVIYRQERVGYQGRPFSIYKFRTMYRDADPSRLATTDDARITNFGRILRRTKGDELPQLWNVLVGEMSLVGPRPELPIYARHWSPRERDIILSVRPGITDPASITFRNEAALLASVNDPQEYYLTVLLPQKARLYCEYVRTRSILGDLSLLLQTVAAVVRR